MNTSLFRRRLRTQIERAVDHGRRAVGRTRTIRRSPEEFLTPSFVILGGQRCGTTSLYAYLSDHPQVAPARVKEIHYFDVNHHRGRRWYAGHFPLAANTPADLITGEASPYYLLHPHAPARLAAELPPSVHLVVLARDPVERAVSHHRHAVAKGFETLSFDKAIDLEPARTDHEWQRVLADPSHNSFALQHFSYVRRGRYIEQLLRWEQAVGRDRLTVLDADAFFADPEARYLELQERLGLRPHRLGDYVARNTYRRSQIPETTRRRLADHFAPHNDALERWLGRPLSWTS